MRLGMCDDVAHKGREIAPEESSEAMIAPISIATDDLLFAVAEEGLREPVEEGQASVGLEPDDDAVRAFDQVAVLGLALHEGLLDHARTGNAPRKMKRRSP